MAGGQPVGLSLRDNMIKEAGEEAGLSAAQAGEARATGVLSQMTAKDDGSCLKQSARTAASPPQACPPLVAPPPQ